MLKPSELVPLSAGRIAELLREAGLPEGVLQIVHGGREAVEAICDHPGIEAISFVGSTKVAKIVYRRGTATLKRVLALGGAKNHLIVMPDADLDMTASNVVASMSGCAGQRCMAASVMVAVDKTDHIIRCMVEHARRMVPGRDIGPVISAEAKARIEGYIAEAEAGGAEVLVDGRNAMVPGHEGGYYLGPTIIDRVTAGHADRAGGSIRAGAGHHPEPRRGRGDRRRERLAATATRRRSSPRAAGSPGTSWSARAPAWWG